MPASRREFLVAAGLVAGSLMVRGRAVALQPADEPTTFFKWQPLSEDAWVGFGQGGNTLVLMGKSAAALIDCKNAPFGAALRREAEALGAPVKLVINTHHHADHTGGNHAFIKDLPLVGHEKCKPRIAANMNRYISQAKEAVLTLAEDKSPAAAKVHDDAKAYLDRINDLKPEQFEPKMTVGDSRELEVGGQKLVLRHFGPGHTDNDLAVFIPRQNLVHAGDLLFHKNHPFLDSGGGGSVQGWIDSVRQVIDLCDAKTRVIPGHGEVTDLAGLKLQVEYWEVTREAVQKAIKEGKTRAEAVKLEPEQFKDYPKPERRQMTLGAIYDELKPPAK